MDIGEQWLKENDPLYIHSEKRSRLSHPYLTDYQVRWRAKHEIPASNIWQCRSKLNLSDDDARELINYFK